MKAVERRGTLFAWLGAIISAMRLRLRGGGYRQHGAARCRKLKRHRLADPAPVGRWNRVGLTTVELSQHEGPAVPQIFHPSMNTVARVSLFGAVFIGASAIGFMLFVARSPYATDVGVVREQPVPFSHQHHVGDIGLDCRYCHTSVEESSFAGIPPTKTCMNCHSQLFADSPMLKPVRDSLATGEPLHWTRVHDVPDFVYFNHSIHIHKGISCTQCHGEVNQMPLMWREQTLHMQWCLDCHRHPDPFVTDRDQTFAVAANVLNNEASQRDLATAYRVKSKTSCYTCHR